LCGSDQNEKSLQNFSLQAFLTILYLKILKVAEREGFEPPEAFTSTVFKTAAFDRSAISPAQK
jgi:hypothetical protein